MKHPDDQSRLRAALAQLEQIDARTAPTRVETALRAELQWRRRRATLLWAVPLAVTAALVLALVAHRPAAQKPAQAPIAKLVAPAPEPPRPTPVVRRPPAPAVKAPPLEIYSDFVAVGPWPVQEPMERGSIVRVRLPSSALPGFGIPISAERWNESVPADLVLAEDGSIRGVRFVSNRH